MQRITPGRAQSLHDVAGTRRLEQDAAALLPPHTLMQRAGLAAARLALALAPHARRIWVACGPGNNGGDGLEAAMHLRRWGKEPLVTLAGDPARLPPDAAGSWARARQAGVVLQAQPPAEWDLCLDALLGIGLARAPQGELAACIARMNAGTAPVIAIDIPSGLDADTGSGDCVVRAAHTLSLLTLKPGLYTAQGRDACGQVWLDDLGTATPAGVRPVAQLIGAPPPQPRPHASHKGSYGDVAVIGGAAGMGGAAVLAASAALHGGAGRVFVGLLDPLALAQGTMAQPELMFRPWGSLALDGPVAVACGCGGGDAVAQALPAVLAVARRLVLDADALNAIARQPPLQTLLQARAPREHTATVLTPHPLEAARLLGCSTAEVQADRLRAAGALAGRFGCVVVLKGSGTVVAAPGGQAAVNPTGNARLATAGTGDVLAGLLAAHLAAGEDAFQGACNAVYRHAAAADRWPAVQALTAARLARAL